MVKKTIKIWHVNVDNIFISELVRTKTNSKYLIEYLNKVIKALVLIMTKTNDMLRHLKLKMEIKITKTN